MAPSATERLEDRTLLAGTPLSLSPAADGDITDDGMNGTWDSVDTASGIVTWKSPPSSGWVGREDRGVLEFDTSAAAATVLESAALSVKVTSVTYTPGDVLRIAVYAYAGDGVVTAADATRIATKVGSLTIDTSAGPLGRKSVALDAAALQPLVSAGGHVGFLTVFESPVNSAVGIGDSEAFATERPTLELVVNRSAVTVDTLADENDGNYVAGDLSLREAIGIADAGGTVTFASALAGGAITLGGTQLLLTKNVTIAGLGASRLTVSGNNASRVFEVQAGVTAEIRSLTVTAGKAGSAALGGAIFNAGSLTVANSVISASTADYGGGVLSDAGSSLTVDASEISGNTAQQTGGGVYFFGTGLITRSTIAGNTAGTAGGGIYNSGNVAASDSTVSGNSTTIGSGGGLFNAAGTFTASNVTVSGNSAAQYGGGIRQSDGTVLLRNATVYGNRADSNGSGGETGGGVSAITAGSVTLHNTLVAGNTRGFGAGTANDVGGTLAGASSFNLIANAASAGGLTHGVSGNIVGVTVASVLDPVLRDNGGPTKTHALRLGSAAIDAGSNAQALAPGGGTLTSDQRGLARVLGSAVDIGAYETLASVVVDTLADEDDGNYSAGDLSLREAIKLVAHGGSITFAAPIAGGTIVLGGTRLDVSAAVTITGPGVTISGNNTSQIFAVAAGASLSLVGMTLTNGHASNDSFDTWEGGAIFNEGTLTLTNVVLRDSTADFRGSILHNEGAVTMTGGAIRGGSVREAVVNYGGTFSAAGVTFTQNTGGVIFNWATLAIADSMFQANEGLPIYNFGSGANTTVARSTFLGNVGGGAVKNHGSTFLISDSVFAGNTQSSAGAIWNFSGVMEITGSAIYGNVATTFHGGAIENSGTLRVSNSTISGNEAGWYGGALYAWSGSATFRNVTITGNRVNLDRTGFEDGAGIYQRDQAVVTLYNTIVAGNVLGGAGVAEDIHGSVTGTHNIIGSAGAAGGLTSTNGNIVGVSAAAVLDPVLKNNGGPTLTHALVAGGIAINAGSNGQALNASSPGSPAAADQRGAPRIVNGTVDIGAVEAPKPASVVVDILADEDDGNYAAGDLSLREAVSVVASGGTITFAASLASGTITLGGTEIALTRDVTIVGLGASLLTVSGNDASRIFQVSAGATVAISGLALSRGRTNGAGGAILNFGTLALSACAVRSNFAGDVGGGVCNSQAASLAVETTDFSLNHGGWGGGAIFNSGDYSRYLADGTFERFEASRVSLSGVTIAANTGRIGGGVVNHGVFAASDSVVSGNTANRDGGGIYNAGDLDITGGEVSDNAANGVDYGTDFGGGGIFNWGRVTLTGTTVAGNRARLLGGGLFSDGGTGVSIVASTFSDNFADNSGGGICVLSGSLTVANSTISGNATAGSGGGILSDSATLRNSTVFGNRADADGNTYGDGGGLYGIGGAQTLYNTLVVGNISGFAEGVPDDAYVYGGLALAGAHNLIGDAATAGGLTHGSNGNIVGVDWITILDPVLRDNGGPTKTHALLVGSIAVNSGSNARALAADGTPLSSDQRGVGFPRVVGGTVDIGAFEATNTPPVPKGDALATTEDSALAGSLFSDNGSGADADPDGDALTVVAVNGSAADVGSVITLASGAKLRVNADGTFTFDPNGAFESLRAVDGFTAALYAFTYAVSDGFGGTATSGAVITIQGVNDAPIAAADSVRLNEDGTASGSLLANDGDPEGHVLRVAAVNGRPLPGWVVLESGARLWLDVSGTYAYDPAGAFVQLRRGQTATDSFTYTVSDGYGGASTGTVTVTIEGGGSEADLVGYHAGEWRVAASTGSAFADGFAAGWANAAWTALRTGDFDGDGRTDVLGLLNGEWYVGLARTANSGLIYFAPSPRWGKWSALAAWENVLVGDIDGDGKDDVVAEAGGVWYGATSTGAAFLTPRKLTGTSDPTWHLATLADVTGDGKDDLALVHGGDWYVAVSAVTPTGGGFGAATRWTRMGAGPYQLLTLADMNDDGRLDAVGFAGGEWRVGTSNGTDAFAVAPRAKWAATTWLDPLVGDFDGDGRLDLAARYGGQWWVGLADESGGEQSRTRWASWNNLAWGDVRVADFDGDGRSDIAARYNGEWYVACSTGSAFTTALWGRWREAAWTAVAGTEVDGAIPPLASSAAGLRLAAPAAPTASPSADDEPLTLFWSQADKDKDFAARLAAV